MHPWCWIRKDAAEIRDILRAGPPGMNSGMEVIWKTNNKYVLRLKTESGLDLACKWYVKLRQLPYSFSWTLAAKEAYNFKRFAGLGLPLVKLIATGEDRGFFHARNAFIVTEFAEGFLDGRYFMEDFPYEAAMRDEFTRKNFVLIARMHDAGICHYGFTPMNELWRKLPEPDANGDRLDIRWLDIATCHRAPVWLLKRRIVEDLGHFLRFYAFTPEERREFLRIYLDATKVKRFNLDSLCLAVEKNLAARIRLKEAKAARKAKKNRKNA